MPKFSSPRKFVIVDGSTISESRDRQVEGRLPKRRRTRDDDSDSDTFTGNEPATRDPDYYSEMEIADCIIRVRNTLFKVERVLLESSIILQGMMDQAYSKEDKPSDDHPLWLPAATVDGFRALLWILLTTPERVKEELEAHFDLGRIICLVSITRTYGFTNIQSWAQETIQKIIQDKHYMDSCSSANLTSLLDVAVESHDVDLRDSVIRIWQDRVSKNSTPSVPAMLAADKHDLAELRGVAYYVHIQDMTDRQTSLTALGATQLRADPKLHNGQVMRVLSGYWSLVSFWERFRRTPLALPRAGVCTDSQHKTCMTTWDRRWHSAVGWKRILGYNNADILGLLACLRDQLKGDEDLAQGISPECKDLGLNALKESLETVRKGLAEHFLGCI